MFSNHNASKKSRDREPTSVRQDAVERGGTVHTPMLQSSILQMQKTMGNRAVTHYLNTQIRPIQGRFLPVIQRAPRTQNAVMEWRKVFDEVSAALEAQREGLTVTRKGATPLDWQLTVETDAIPKVVWTLKLTFTNTNAVAVDVDQKVLTVDAGNSAVTIQEEDDQYAFGHAVAQKIDDEINRHIYKPADLQAEGVFQSDRVEQDPANINEIDKLKIKLLKKELDEYFASYNVLNAAPNGPKRVKANAIREKLSRQVANMGLNNPLKLDALRNVDDEDLKLSADQVRMINKIARHDMYKAFEQSTGALHEDGKHLISDETVDHLIYPEERDAATFVNMGIGGGHDDKELKAFVATHPQYSIELEKEVPVEWDGKNMTLRMYKQLMDNPLGGAKIASNVKKTTTDNLNLFLYLGKAGLVEWIRSGKVMPGDGEAFGKFSGQDHGLVKHDDSEVEFGGYGTKGLLSDKKELKTLFATDEWFAAN